MKTLIQTGIILFLCIAQAYSQHDHGETVVKSGSDGYGHVEFLNSGSRAAQADFLDGLAFHGPHIHGRLKKLIALTSIFFSLIHGRVTVLAKCLCVEPIIGIDTYTYASSDMEIVMVCGMDLCHGLQYLSGFGGRIQQFSDLRKQYDKFIAALSAHGITTAYAIRQTFSDRCHEIVTNRMPT